MVDIDHWGVDGAIQGVDNCLGVERGSVDSSNDFLIIKVFIKRITFTFDFVIARSIFISPCRPTCVMVWTFAVA